jgi:hypothetical protein
MFILILNSGIFINQKGYANIANGAVIIAGP